MAFGRLRHRRVSHHSRSAQRSIVARLPHRPKAVDLIRLKELPFGAHHRHALVGDVQVRADVLDAKGATPSHVSIVERLDEPCPILYASGAVSADRKDGDDSIEDAFRPVYPT